METALKILFWIVSTFGYWYVGPIMWGWFVVPLGVRDINSWHFLGLVSLLTLMRPVLRDNPKTEDPIEYYASYALLPWLALLFGWIYTFFM
jgi:hypothetical protein